MDLKNFASAIAQIAEEKGISKEKILESIETAIAAAYKKEYGQKGQVIKAKLNTKTGDLKFWQVKTVVDESMIYSEEELEALKNEDKVRPPSEKEEKIRFNPERYLMLDEAKKINSKAKLEDELEMDLKAQESFGRIAAQTAKQVIMQRIRESERESILEEYKSKEGEIISAVVQRVEGRNAFLDIGKTLGVLPKEEQVMGEFYRPGQRLKVFILKIEETSKGPNILLSRAYPKIISKLFELEVPEISSGQVEVKSIAREAGSRSKIAVYTEEEGIDPIGSCVGQKGARVMAVINELGGEKIDIIEYSDEPESYIANALSPAKVIEVEVLPRNKALVTVPDEQLSLAIGKDGQNVRLAAKLTGWKIDVKSADGKQVISSEDEEIETVEPKPKKIKTSDEEKESEDKKDK